MGISEKKSTCRHGKVAAGASAEAPFAALGRRQAATCLQDRLGTSVHC